MLRSLFHLTGNSGALGAIVAAMGCGSCFPALAALGASLGLGFLAHFEGILINTLLPLFTAIALLANGLAWLSHRRLWRTLLAMAGPTLVLLTLYPLWRYGWSTWLFYAGLVLMFLVAVWDMVAPPRRTCITRAPQV